jgi:hypothetical protein
VSFDRNLFSHFASIFLTFGATFGAEKLLEYNSSQTDVSLNQLMLSVGCLAFGLLFLIMAGVKILKHYRLKKGLFSDENLLSDELIVLRSDGTKTVTAIVSQ